MSNVKKAAKAWTPTQSGAVQLGRLGPGALVFHLKKSQIMKQIALYPLAIVAHLSIMSLLAYAVETENDLFSGQRREVSALAKLDH